MDVRLTMGGEPTFVSVDDRDGGEWNTDAMGPTKRGLRRRSGAQRLRKQYGPAGSCTSARASGIRASSCRAGRSTCFWRADGEPIWHDPRLIADERDDHGAHAEDGAPLPAPPGVRLGVIAATSFAGLRRRVVLPLARRQAAEQRRSVRVAPRRRGRARRACAACSSAASSSRVGYVLPIARDERDDRRWRSTPWYLRDDRMYLVPGDSPMGFRLPLDSLPWARAGDMPWIYPPDANDDRAAARASTQATTRPRAGMAFVGRKPVVTPSLAHETPSPAPARRRGRGRRCGGAARREPRRIAPASSSAPRSAPRRAHGRLYIFMPPTSALDDYLDAGRRGRERRRGRLRLPIVLEGYAPPHDPRLVLLHVTPDPGVIEVNIHPASSWSELVEQTTHLYEDGARDPAVDREVHARRPPHRHRRRQPLRARRRDAGATRPFLRRPDLLASLIGYWHNHPALSYLFSGMFIGPTSQAPRIDEARNDSVYEIEIAFAELARVAEVEAGETPPWLIDRLLRNLLIDVTGNTHRAEFCIDKLYSPDGPTGRLGLLELRAFEMPPHARMSLVQQLLMRALVARFWAEPYRPGKLARWGTELHDRFMLPHFVWADLGDVVGELNDAGYPFDLAWFAPHLEFRFPLLGDFSACGRLGRAAHGARALARPGRGERRAAAPRATSTRRSSGSRCASAA